MEYDSRQLEAQLAAKTGQADEGESEERQCRAAIGNSSEAEGPTLAPAGGCRKIRPVFLPRSVIPGTTTIGNAALIPEIQLLRIASSLEQDPRVSRVIG